MVQTDRILQHFYEVEVPQHRLRYLLALEDFFQTAKEQLTQQFQQDFQRICQELKQQQLQRQKEPLGHISFSLLRTELLAGRTLLLVEATNGEWFFDTKPIVTTYDAGWALRFLQDMMAELTRYSQTFNGMITQVELEAVQLQEVRHFYQYIVALLRYALTDIDRHPDFKALWCEPAIEIRVGELMDTSEVVYAADTSSRDAHEIKQWLEQRLEDEYAYEVFKQLDLSNGQYTQLDARYAFFQKSTLVNSSFAESILTGASFSDSHLSNTDFSFSTIHEVDFTNAQLQGANFHRAQGSAGLPDRQQWHMPGYLPVRFHGAQLDNANFTLADLRGADFQGASLQHAQFAGANLEGAIFSKESQDIVKLEPFQAMRVIWQ